MIDIDLYDYVYDNFALSYDFYYGSAEGASNKYCVMYKISDLERPESFCNDQGDTGRALFQFSFYSGGNAIETVKMANDFKEQFADIIGVISTNYRIDENSTYGARLLSEGSQNLEVWGAFFESEIWWVKI